MELRVARAVVIEQTGGPEVMKIVDLDVGEPAEGEVRLRVEASGVNRADQMMRTGTFAYQPTLPARLGIEAAAVVDAVGPGVTEFSVGDEVLTAAIIAMERDGTYAEQVILPVAQVIRRPGGIDAVTGAALWVAYSTAYGGMIEAGGLLAGDHGVITAASSSVGLAAIQIANQLGAVPMAVTRTADKKQALLDAGAAHVIVAAHEDVGTAVKAATGGDGAAMVFDPIAGPGLIEVATAVRYGGTVVVYGWLDTRPALLPTNWPIRVIGYIGTDSTMNLAARERILAFLDAGLRAGTIKPTIDHVFDFDDIVEAHRYLESSDQFGKIVVRL